MVLIGIQCNNDRRSHPFSATCAGPQLEIWVLDPGAVDIRDRFRFYRRQDKRVPKQRQNLNQIFIEHKNEVNHSV